MAGVITGRANVRSPAKCKEKISSSNLISNFSRWINISNETLYTSMEENCYTKDILYSSHIKNAEQIAMRYQENYSLQLEVLFNLSSKQTASFAAGLLLLFCLFLFCFVLFVGFLHYLDTWVVRLAGPEALDRFPHPPHHATSTVGMETQSPPRYVCPACEPTKRGLKKGVKSMSNYT